MFETSTVIVILIIFSVFAFAASRAEKVVTAKAKALREAKLQTIQKSRKK
jgi:uncharacterized membrane protein